MNITLGLPELSLVSSTYLYMGNQTVMGHVFLGLSILLAFGRLVIDMHKIEEKKREKTLRINDVKDSLAKAASYIQSQDNIQH